MNLALDNGDVGESRWETVEEEEGEEDSGHEKGEAADRDAVEDSEEGDSGVGG